MKRTESEVYAYNSGYARGIKTQLANLRAERLSLQNKLRAVDKKISDYFNRWKEYERQMRKSLSQDDA